MARRFFEPIAPEVIPLELLEAELAKLFTNAYRYIEFATVNQFYMIAETRDADYHRIQEAIKHDYPRLAHLPGPGFAAGPCLLKDTMQLAAFYNHNFSLGHAALWINEGLPDFIVEQLKRKHPLREKTVGILGMAFKADNDDKRDSLSYKLRKLLRVEARRTLCHDPYVQDPSFAPLETVVSESDILIVATPIWLARASAAEPDVFCLLSTGHWLHAQVRIGVNDVIVENLHRLENIRLLGITHIYVVGGEPVHGGGLVIERHKQFAEAGALVPLVDDADKLLQFLVQRI